MQNTEVENKDPAHLYEPERRKNALLARGCRRYLTNLRVLATCTAYDESQF